MMCDASEYNKKVVVVILGEDMGLKLAPATVRVCVGCGGYHKEKFIIIIRSHLSGI